MSDESELRTIWEEEGILETELAVNRGGTIVQGAPSVEPAVSWSAVVESLPPIGADHGALIALGSEIGRGAMGVVQSGRQRSLDREVAVKTTIEGASGAATQALLREAWISGQLEHPNVIPVHALYRSDEAPLLVMKRVEGRAWSQALRDGGPQEAHLRILTQVCHAVHFAHTRGFVHLDLKPDNVMIGDYGEIYLLDWGIAASLHEDAPPFIPRASAIHGVLGTPAYMAPELAAGQGKIDARTDVYLLGAVLCELLTGRPPHASRTLIGSITSAFTSGPPDWPAEVPAELAAVAERATSRAPADRYADAAELREALDDYLVHADSLSLAAAARQRFDRVLEAMEQGDAEVDRLAGEAEFGFRQALDVWPDNNPARDSLQELLERMIERDLAQRRWQLAARRLEELPRPRPDLDERMQALAEADSNVADELQRLRDDADLGKAASQRSYLAYGGAFVWVALILGLGAAIRLGRIEPHHWHMFAITSVGMIGVLTFVFLTRKALLANAINRQTVTLICVGWFFGVLYWALAWRAGGSFATAIVGVAPLSAMAIGAIAATVDSRMVPSAIVSTLGLLMLLPFPSWTVEIMAVTGGVVLVMIGRAWKGRRRSAP